MKRFFFVLLLVSVVFAIGGCAKKKIPIPAYTASSPLEISPGQKLEPIGLNRTIVSIKRGSLIGAFHSGYSPSSSGICNYNRCADIFWSSSGGIIGGNDDEFTNFFYDALTSRGYNVVGDPKKVFDRDKELGKARYWVAADIKDLKANVCRVNDFWTGQNKGTESAEVWMKVEWTVYSPLEKKSLFQVETTGYMKSDEERGDGFNTTLLEAFASAAEELAADKDFYALVSGRSVKKEMAANSVVGDSITIPRLPNYLNSFSQTPDRVTDCVVTVRGGGGHGSGFVISEDGLIITNNHVVGENDEMMVRFENGFELPAKVLKREPVRDVALLKVGVSKSRALPIRTAPLKLVEPVFAVGTPLLEDLNSTITQGVVSAFREDDQTGLPSIQADVDISGGNSGGALVDENGNVVGITVAGYFADHSSGGLNIFIPIMDGLRALNVHLADTGN